MSRRCLLRDLDTGFCILYDDDYYKQEATLPDETNPKAARAIADGKAPLRFLQPAANAPTSRVLRHGAEKYGYRNWRFDRIRLATYLEAVQRHVDAMKEGEWLDPDSGEPHWAHIGANVHVVLDADAFGTLDRDMEPESKPLSKRVHAEGDFDAKGEKPERKQQDARTRPLAQPLYSSGNGWTH